jgi:membrane protein DedA with SNARE-associated domain
MAQLTELIVRYGLPLIFLIVLLEQIGLPIPAIPVLIVAGALAVDRGLSAPMILAIAVLASVVADSLWYWLGRRLGRRVLRLLCRVSLSPDSCVRQTESLFERYGMPSLLFAKFIPGFSTVAPPLAGAVGATVVSFLLYDAGGALVWAGAGVGGGMIFHSAIDRVLDFLTTLGGGAIVVLAIAFVIFIGAKWWQRRRFYQMLRTARITPLELWNLIQEGKNPVVLDVRTTSARGSDPRRLPGASVLATSELDARLADLPRDREIILYCT